MAIKTSPPKLIGWVTAFLAFALTVLVLVNTSAFLSFLSRTFIHEKFSQAIKNKSYSDAFAYARQLQDSWKIDFTMEKKANEYVNSPTALIEVLETVFHDNVSGAHSRVKFLIKTNGITKEEKERLENVLLLLEGLSSLHKQRELIHDEDSAIEARGKEILVNARGLYRKMSIAFGLEIKVPEKWDEIAFYKEGFLRDFLKVNSIPDKLADAPAFRDILHILGGEILLRPEEFSEMYRMLKDESKVVLAEYSIIMRDLKGQIEKKEQLEGNISKLKEQILESIGEIFIKSSKPRKGYMAQFVGNAICNIYELLAIDVPSFCS